MEEKSPQIEAPQRVETETLAEPLHAGANKASLALFLDANFTAASPSAAKMG